MLKFKLGLNNEAEELRPGDEEKENRWGGSHRNIAGIGHTKNAHLMACFLC